MKSEHEKENIMSHLVNLKTAGEKFKKISITDDYTLEERREIKDWVEKAKAKNREEDEDSQFIWKVRGTPNSTSKNRLRLIKFTKRQEIQ